MRDWRIIAFIAATAAILVIGPAQARHHQVIAADVVPEQCTVVTMDAPYIYPAPNWGPFFRYHLYRYALVPTCAPTTGWVASPQPVISVRY
jgi:hypothetical protein